MPLTPPTVPLEAAYLPALGICYKDHVAYSIIICLRNERHINDNGQVASSGFLSLQSIKRSRGDTRTVAQAGVHFLAVVPPYHYSGK